MLSNKNPFAAEKLDVSSTAVPLTAATYTDAPDLQATITVEDDSIRWWVSGDTPTASEGHLAEVGDIIYLNNRYAVVRFRAIRVTTDAVIQVTYEK